MYLLCFLVPITHVDEVKNAIFAVGAGSTNKYMDCSWQTLGEAQFTPRSGSDPYIGEINKPTKISEYKVEIICTEAQIKAAISALLQAHPYETPSYQVIKFDTLDSRIGVDECNERN